MAKRRKKSNNTISEKEKLEREFRFYWKALGDGTTLTEQHRGILSHINKKGRTIYTGHKFDFAVPELKLAIEIQGGIFGRGRHVRPQGYHNDRKKLRLAMMQGWIILEYTTIDFKPEHISAMIEEVGVFLKMRRGESYSFGKNGEFSNLELAS